MVTLSRRFEGMGNGPAKNLSRFVSGHVFKVVTIQGPMVSGTVHTALCGLTKVFLADTLFERNLF